MADDGADDGDRGPDTGWTREDLPDLAGRTAIVTGANSGVGFETAAALADAGATVVLACRDLRKAEAAQDALRRRSPASAVEVLRLDLASQSQIVEAAAETLERFPRIDMIINNAGAMALPHSLTEDGFETVFGTNHLGHFAYTGRTLPAILAASRGRVVTVSSLSHHVARIRWDDLNGERCYGRMRAYARSKLANMLFALGLQRRFACAGLNTASLAAHPGFANTDIGRNAERANRARKADRGYFFVQSAADAASSLLRAATDPCAYGGQVYGPSRRRETFGPAAVVRPARRALSETDQDRLWQMSEDLTGVEYDLTVLPPAV